MSYDNERPDPNQIPSAEWLVKQLASEGDNAGADFNDGDTVLGYFGWDSVTVKHSVDGKVIRHEIEIWWEPEELQGKKNKRHVRRFRLEEVGNGETIDA